MTDNHRNRLCITNQSVLLCCWHISHKETMQTVSDTHPLSHQISDYTRNKPTSATYLLFFVGETKPKSLIKNRSGLCGCDVVCFDHVTDQHCHLITPPPLPIQFGFSRTKFGSSLSASPVVSVTSSTMGDK